MDAEVAADSTVLIFLAKLDRLDVLRTSFERVLIPEPVYEEVVVQGKTIGAKDATLVDRAVDAGWIQVVDVDPDPSIEAFNLERGETSVLSLARERGHDVVLADEESVREVARLHGLEPRGTLWFLFGPLQRGDRTFEEFVGALESLLEAGFYLDEARYLEAIRVARRLDRR